MDSIKHNDTQHNALHCDIQHKGTQNNGLNSV
jgi:hypothetical protein